MSSTYTYPGVYIQELPSPVHPITGVATSVAAFVGYTATGIDNRAEMIFSFSDYQRLFGGLASNSELSYAVQQFFLNGGSQAWVVRTPGHYNDPPATEPPYAEVLFGTMTFSALSSGTWANGQLLIDIDVQGLNLSTTTNPPGDPLAFNLTVTNLAGGTPEYFPALTLSANLQNFIANVLNDPDNGSQLVNVDTSALSSTPAALALTGVVGNAVSLANVDTNLAGGTAAAGTMTVTGGLTKVSGTGGTTFGTDIKVGMSIAFSTDATGGVYQVGAIISTSALTLAMPYAGAAPGVAQTGAIATIVDTTVVNTTDFGVQLALTEPSPSISPFPIDVKVFARNTPLPQTISGLAAQLQRAINAVLTVQMPGASAQCSVSGPPGSQAIRVNVLLPQVPDAVLTVTTPSAASGFTDTSALLGFPGPNPANVAHYALGTDNTGWGQETSSKAASAMDGLPGTQELIGDPLAQSGIYALSNVAFNLLCIPDAARASAGNPNVTDTYNTSIDPVAIYSAAVALCVQSRAMVLIDPPPTISTVAAAVDWKSSTIGVFNANGAAFWPRLRLADPLNNSQLRTFAPSGLVAGVYANTDTTRGVWKAPAGIGAVLNGVQNMTYQMSDAENGVLNPLGLNCFRTFPVYGPVLWGARTLLGADADASQWKYVPIRRVALFIESSLYQGTQWVVFEPNDEPLWSAIRLNVGSFMQNLFIEGFFQGQTPSQAYFVKCDSETTTQTDIDNGVVNIVVGFAPLYPAEFVVIQIQQMTGQTSS